MTSRVRIGAFVVAVALVGACSGGKDDNKVTAAGSDKTTTTLPLDTGESTTTAAPGTSGAAGTTAKGATATTAKPGATQTTTKPGGGPATTASSGEAAPAAAADGTYTYAQSGSTPDGPVPPSGTLVVSNPSYARYYDQSKAPQRLTYVFRSNGAFITGATLTFNGASATCSFGDGVAAPPWPPVVGSSNNKTGSCSTPIGSLTAVVTSKVTSRNGDIVGITTNVHAYNANKSIDVTANDVDGWSISLRVPKTSHQTFSGTAFNNPVNGDVTSTLTGHP